MHECGETVKQKNAPVFEEKLDLPSHLDCTWPKKRESGQYP